MIAAGPGNLILASASALGFGTFTLAGGTVQQVSSASSQLTVTNALTFTGAFPVAFTGNASGNNPLIFTGNAALNAATTILVNNTTTTLTGIVSGAFALTLTGSPVQLGGTALLPNGTLSLQGVSTYSGNTTISGGTLSLNANGQNTAATQTYTVNAGGTLTLDNTASGLTNRLAATDLLTLNGGTYSIIGNSGTTASAQTFATVTLNSGQSIIKSSQPAAGTVTTTATAFNRTAGTTVTFQGVTTDIGTAGNQFVTTAAAQGNVSTTSTLNGSQLLVPYALVTKAGVTDFAQTVAAGSISRFTAYDTSTQGINAALTTSVYKLNSGESITTGTNKNIAGLLITGTGSTLTGGVNSTLTVTSGAVAVTGTGTNILSMTTLNFGAVEGMVQTDTGSAATINSSITATNTVTYGGSGTITLPNANTNINNTVAAQTITPSATLTAGAFTLTFNGATSAIINFNATASNVLTAVQACPPSAMATSLSRAGL